MKTRIVCTIGPASESPEIIKRLLYYGMRVARLNFSHGTHSSHKKNYLILRKIAKEMKKPLAIMADLQGPKIRLSKVSPNSNTFLKKGSIIEVCSGNDNSDNKRLEVVLPNIETLLDKGNNILLGDGLIRLKIIGKRNNILLSRVIASGHIRSHMGVNLVGKNINISGITEKDREDIEFCLDLGIDFFCVSFVCKVDDILIVKKAIEKSDSHTGVIAKIEKPEALKNINKIIDVSDGIMVARGDLGVEVGLAKLPAIQKKLISKAYKKHRIVITATQMLESMTESPVPTRAEVTDVANALYDGTDAVMLSEETAAGKYPVEAVKVMSEIIRETEKNLPKSYIFKTDPHDISPALSIANGAVVAAMENKAQAIIVLSETGYTAQLLSKLRPNIRIIAVLTKKSIYNKLSILRGVEPILLFSKKKSLTLEKQISIIKEEIALAGIINKKDRVIIVVRNRQTDSVMLLISVI